MKWLVAITSLVFGILAMVFSRGLIGLASAIIAIVIGLIALYAMKQSGDITGRTKARWGLGLGISSIIILMIMVAVEVRTQRAVYGLRESHPELFNAYLEKPESKLDETIRQDVAGQSFYDKGLKEEGQKNHVVALAYFQKAIEENLDNADAWFQVGYCYGELGRYQDAVEAYKQAIRIKPDYAMAHNNLGFAYLNLGRNQDAIEACKQAIRIKPDLAMAHYNLGVAYGKLGRWQKAIKSYKQAIRLKPDYAYAHNNLGAAYLITGDKGSALEEYKILKTLDADLASELFNLIYKRNP